jgi:hypothetical protein
LPECNEDEVEDDELGGSYVFAEDCPTVIFFAHLVPAFAPEIEG